MSLCAPIFCFAGYPLPGTRTVNLIFLRDRYGGGCTLMCEVIKPFEAMIHDANYPLGSHRRLPDRVFILLRLRCMHGRLCIGIFV